MSLDERRARIQADSDNTFQRLAQVVRSGERLCVIKAPPGSGKTYTLLQAIEVARTMGLRVAVATQTNAQADDVCERLVRDHPKVRTWRFAASSATPPADPGGLAGWVTSLKDLPHTPHVAVGTTAKWSLISFRDEDPYDILFVDEAWQMDWASFMLLGQVSGRFVLIGDPGQIPPVVAVPVQRWETSPRAPHRAAPELILEDPSIEKVALELTACRRLPAESVRLVRNFYDFHFDAWAADDERWLKPKAGSPIEPVDAIIDALATHASTIATIPTPESGPPIEVDKEIAEVAALAATRLVTRGGQVCPEEGIVRRIEPHDIGITATHRAMNSEILAKLPATMRGEGAIRVDTPERWQGLERPIMIVVHPLSGVVHPSAFDLETGRLCVMASRHRTSMVVISRDHVPATLEAHIPKAEQAVGRPDVCGRGHEQHIRFWEDQAGAGRVVRL